jgi:hypothetical protein
MNDTRGVHVVQCCRCLFRDLPSQVCTQSSTPGDSPWRVRHGEDARASKRVYEKAVGAIGALYLEMVIDRLEVGRVGGRERLNECLGNGQFGDLARGL